MAYANRSLAHFRSLFSIIDVLLLGGLLTVAAHAQTYTVIHTFAGPDGAAPFAGLTPDAAGNFYGTTSSGGTINANCQYGCGTVFKLTHRGSGWILTTLYSFKGGADSGTPRSRVVFGPDGSLYGTTSGGTTNSDKGTVYSLKPPATFCPAVMCPWTKTTLYSFMGGADGFDPLYGDLTFDHQCNIYGTTQYGGLGPFSGWGVVFELTKVNGQWTEQVIHSFDLEPGETDGFSPVAGVTFDAAGNLFGTTPMGGFYDPVDNTYGDGVVFELSPTGTGWQETIVRRFMGPDGEYPGADLTPATIGGNHVLLGTTGAGGSGSCQSFMVQGCGVVFLLGIGNPYSFLPSQPGLSPGGPHSPITEDASGRFFGTTFSLGANNRGNVYQLVYNSDGSWTYTSLYDFTQSDGGFPYGRVVFDGSGNLYGTLPGDSSACDQQHQSCGVIWEVTP